MRSTSGLVWDTWSAGGPFIGDRRPIGRVTVEPSYYLKTAHDAGLWSPNKLPVRWFQNVANSQLEGEVPNIRSISIDRSLDTDAATCEIVMSNQWMNLNSGGIAAFDPYILARPDSRDPTVLGEPGMFSPNHGDTAEARARWGHTKTAWWQVLVPNALLRTYQGFGGAYPMSIPDAMAAGHLYLTGLWLIDGVRITSGGEMHMRCRDMAKLLIEQQLYPPLVPRSTYPLRYCRFDYKTETRQRETTAAGGAGNRTLTMDNSGNYAWTSSGGLHGHHPNDAFDNNADSFWLSVGNSGPEEPYSMEWIQGACGEEIDTVHVSPWAGNYTCYISIFENGGWVDGGQGVVPYSPAGIGRYSGEFEGNVPFVASFGVPWESPTTVTLPRVYRAEYVRFSFTNLAKSEWGPYPYRAGAREVGVSAGKRVEDYKATVQVDGNYLDFSDIVKELLLWSGWWLSGAGGLGGMPAVFGNIEPSGSYANECFPVDAFDKRPVIDAINTVKETIGYVFWVDEDGGARFETPNWWSPGNFMTSGHRTDFIPEIDEKLQLTEYSMQLSDSPARSQIIVSAADPIKFGDNVTYFTPSTASDLKGMVKPAVFVNQVLTDPNEQRTLAELIAMHMYFAQRNGQVTAVANPAIQINDQVRIVERMTADTYIHYVKGMSTQYDAEAGTYTMTLTTHWLGTAESWATSSRRPT